MRMRNPKYKDEVINNCDFLISDKVDFEKEQPIYIEIGMGKGKFITEMAMNNPDINYIGIEKYSSVLIRAVEKRRELEIDNLFFIRMDAVEIEDAFEKGEIDRIYLNFSDPWPKDRHAKRRLTSRQFFERYDKILKDDGIIEFKTDNKDLFDFSLEEVKETKFKVINYTYDLHGDTDAEIYRGNVTTEYEDKFVEKGNKICKLVATRA